LTGIGSFYPQAFESALDADGAQYVVPGVRISVLPIITGTFTLSNGGLPSDDSELVFLYKNVLYFPAANLNNISVAINVAAGSFSGVFTHPVSKKPITFSGLLYQNANSPGAAGFFIGPVITGTSVTGDVLLTP